jgi:ketosteroid isomerase-like protein
MSEENVQIVRRILDARNRRDMDTVMSYAAPDIEFDLSASAGTFAGVYRGHQSLLRLWAAWSEVFSHMHWEAEELIDAGEAVVVPVRFHARGRGSGVETVTRAVHVYWLRDGQVVRYRQLPDRATAFAAAGLRVQRAAPSLARDRATRGGPGGGGRP